MVEPKDFNFILSKGMELSPDKKNYFNGYTVSISPNDLVIVLTQNDQPINLFYTSHTIAKTLSQALNDLLARYEKVTGVTIHTLDELNGLLNKGPEDGQKAVD